MKARQKARAERVDKVRRQERERRRTVWLCLRQLYLPPMAAVGICILQVTVPDPNQGSDSYRKSSMEEQKPTVTSLSQATIHDVHSPSWTEQEVAGAVGNFKEFLTEEEERRKNGEHRGILTDFAIHLRQFLSSVGLHPTSARSSAHP